MPEFSARSHPQELEMIRAAEAGDRDACQRLVSAYMPAIARMARMYSGSPKVSREELIQEGVVGLLRARSRFEPSYGTPFWSYATWWVRQAMQHLVAEVGRPVVISDRAARALARIKAARREHRQAHGREASTADVAAAVRMPVEHVQSLEAIDRPQRSLDEPFPTEEGAEATLGERLADEDLLDAFDQVSERIEVERVRDLSARLGEREQAVLGAHYGLGQEPRTLREIGEEMSLSAERVRQIEERALSKLREAAAEWPAADL